MEKDHFKDRPDESKSFLSISGGDEVLICLKANQKIACEVKHLTRCIVCRKLTRENHPRGIKIEGLTPDGNLVVGRIVYIIKGDKILTKYGLKDIKDINKE